MAIDTIIDYDCIPKDVLSPEGILNRLKARDRAETVLKIYREQGDHRPTSEIGYEQTLRAADGTEYTETVIVKAMLDFADELQEVQDHCLGCPVNRINQPFGCINTINYPISEQAELWLLQKLPRGGSPLLHILRRGIESYGYDGTQARELRNQEGVFFEAHDTLARPYVDDDYIITSDQLFEMNFLVGSIQPGHAAMLLLFYHVIPRDDLEPADITWLLNGRPAARTVDGVQDELPLLLKYEPEDGDSLRDIKNYLHALYLAYIQGVNLLVDV